MSLFRIVGNYYEDILEYFTQEYKKIDPEFDPKRLEKLNQLYPNGDHTEIQTFKSNFYMIFTTANDNKKTEIIQVISAAFRKLERLKEADLTYWKSRETRSKKLSYYIIIVWIVMTCVLLYTMIRQMMYLNRIDNSNFFMFIEIVLVHIIIWTLFSTGFIFFWFNFKETRLMSKDIHELHKANFYKISQKLISDVNLQYFFVAIGHYINDDNNAYNNIIKAIQKRQITSSSKNDRIDNKDLNMIPDSGLFDSNVNDNEDTKTTDTNTNSCPGKYSTNTYMQYLIDENPCKNKTNLYDVFNDLEKHKIFSNGIFNFYNYGKGYTDIRKLVVKSNTIYMLKEVRSILNFYYYLLNKKGDIDEDKMTIENKQVIIDKFVIEKLKNIDIKHFTQTSASNNDYESIYNSNITGDAKSIIDIPLEHPVKDAYFKAINNNNFTQEMKLFDKALIDVAIVLYPFYKKTSLEDSSLASIKAYHPIHRYKNDSFDKDSYVYFKQYLLKNENETMETFKMLSPSDVAIVFTNKLQDFKEYIIRYLRNVLYTLNDNVVIPLNKLYLEFHMTKEESTYSDFTNNPFLLFDETYRTLFIESVIKTLIPVTLRVLSTEVKSSGTSLKVAMLASNLAEDLSKYKIRVSEHTTYILDTMIENNNGSMDKELLDYYKDVLKRVDNAIDIKKNVKEISDKSNKRFVDMTEFTKRIDDVIIDDFIDGTKIDYLTDIIKEFYEEVSGAIGSSNMIEPQKRHEFNIFYKKQRQLSRTKLLVNFLIALIIQGYLYYMSTYIKKLVAKNINSIISNAPSESVKEEKKDDNETEQELKRRESLTRRIQKDIYYFNNTIKVIITTLLVVFVISMILSYVRKNADIFEFNRETVERNTGELQSSIISLNNHIKIIQHNTKNVSNLRIADVPTAISNEDKSNIYIKLVKIIDSYEKCNYIINISKSALPFPYTEITMDAFMLVFTIVVLLHVFGKMNPMKRLKDIKELYKLRENSIFKSDEELNSELEDRLKCNSVEIDTIAFTLKAIFFTFVIIFLLYYIHTIVETTGDFKNGLYNSGYFEESRCYNR